MLQLRDLAVRSDFRVGSLSVSPSRRLIQGPCGASNLEPLIMQVFLCLLASEGRVVTRDDLFNECWGGAVVGDDSLNRAINKVRRVTCEVAPGQFEIETIPRTGYRLTGPAAPVEPPTIAVFPFENLSSEPDQDYFVEGMADEIVAVLTRIRSLLVISSESSAALKGTGWDEQEAASRMGVRYILAGSVRRSGSKVRIAVNLVDTRRRVQIWAERFDYELKDVFALQDRIALEVATAIEPSVQEAEVKRASRRPFEDLGCYDLYLRAAPLRATCRKAEVMQALELLERALVLDPHFAPALAQAAGCHSQIYENGWDKERQWHRTQGLVLADRALMNGAEDASVLAQLANALMDLEADVARAIALADRAIAINPGLARAWFISGLAHLLDHDAELAVQHLQTAARLDPISPLNDVIRAHIAVGRFLAGDNSGALKGILGTAHRTIRIHLTLAAIYGYLDMPEESRDEIARFQSRSPLSAEDIIASGIPHQKSREMLLEGIKRGRGPVRVH
ncbi:MAG: winged helix-turn-helix domain-containing protein [Sphingomicrobium sp.]